MPDVGHPDELPVLRRLRAVKTAGDVSHEADPGDRGKRAGERGGGAHRDDACARRLTAAMPAEKGACTHGRNEQREAAIGEHQHAGAETVGRGPGDREHRPLRRAHHEKDTHERLQDVEQLLVRRPDEHLGAVVREQQHAGHRREDGIVRRRRDDLDEDVQTEQQDGEIEHDAARVRAMRIHRAETRRVLKRACERPCQEYVERTALASAPFRIVREHPRRIVCEL